LLALFVALGGTAFAVTHRGGGGSGQLYACVAKRSHALRLARAGKPCGGGQRKISWNRRGRRGPRGHLGPNGATGARGARGATGARGPAGTTGPAGATGPGSTLAFDEVAAQIVSHDPGYAKQGGPAVTVDVPNAGGGQGFIEVSAQVDANEGASAIGLFDVTGGGNTFVSGQDTDCLQFIPATLPGDLFMTDDGTAGTYGTPMSFNAFQCSPTAGPPAPVLLEVTAGTRTFELEYADCECGGVAPEVSNRRLWIAAQPTS
jgi:hypothetical protein